MTVSAGIGRRTIEVRRVKDDFDPIRTKLPDQARRVLRTVNYISDLWLDPEINVVVFGDLQGSVFAYLFNPGGLFIYEPCRVGLG